MMSKEEGLRRIESGETQLEPITMQLVVCQSNCDG